jgi:hypothetical protein
MKKNLLHKEAADKIIARAKLLQPHSQAQWGQMNVTEMLLHCNLANTQIFKGATVHEKTSLKQYLLRILALYIARHFQKNRKGDERNDTKGKINALQFEEQKALFIQTIRRFPGHKAPLTLHHMAFGNLSTKQWGIAAWKHMDHHLRQFGV